MRTIPANKPRKTTFSAQNNACRCGQEISKFPNLVLDSIACSALSSHKPKVTEYYKRSIGQVDFIQNNLLTACEIPTNSAM